MGTIINKTLKDRIGRVALLFGGLSPEREISLLSGKAVLESLKRLEIDVTAIDVGEDLLQRLEQLGPDFVVNMLHGCGGEDGTIQGVLEIMRIPYSGSGVLASALAMDKVKSKLIWQQLGLRTAEFRLLQEASDWAGVVSQLGPVVVKPVNGGSSLGIELADSAEALERCFREAKKFDSSVFAEQMIVGEEFSVGVLNDEVLPAIQLRTGREFFDYEAKYVDEDTEYICPAKISSEEMDALNTLAKRAYDCLGCSGLARVDLMQHAKTKEFYLLEVNTIPGMTDHSFIPHAASKVGMDFDSLMTRILTAELEALA